MSAFGFWPLHALTDSKTNLTNPCLDQVKFNSLQEGFQSSCHLDIFQWMAPCVNYCLISQMPSHSVLKLRKLCNLSTSSYTINSKVKSTFLKQFFTLQAPLKLLRLDKTNKMMILAIEANDATSPNCTFLHILNHCASQQQQAKTVYIGTRIQCKASHTSS